MRWVKPWRYLATRWWSEHRTAKSNNTSLKVRRMCSSSRSAGGSVAPSPRYLRRRRGVGAACLEDRAVRGGARPPAAPARWRVVGGRTRGGGVFVPAGGRAGAPPAPADGSAYSVGQKVIASYSCDAGGGATITACAGPVASG